MSMTFDEILTIATNTCRSIKPDKARALAEFWLSGDRNRSRIARQTGLHANTVYKIGRALEAADPLIQQIRIDEEAAHESAARSIKPAPPEPEADAEGRTILTGTTYLNRVDELLLAALEDNDERKIKALHEIRKDLRDFAVEMPITHMDIERTIGYEGLSGMDSVIRDTLVLFFEDISYYPVTRQFLSETFSVSDSWWSEKFGIRPDNKPFKTSDSSTPDQTVSEKRSAIAKKRQAMYPLNRDPVTNKFVPRSAMKDAPIAAGGSAKTPNQENPDTTPDKSERDPKVAGDQTDAAD